MLTCDELDRVVRVWWKRCDRCGAMMTPGADGHGFERWSCPGCRQVVGTDRDLRVGGRLQLQ